MKVKVTHTQIIDKLTEKGPCKEYILEGEPVKDECGCTCHTTRPWLRKEGTCECDKEPVNEHEELCSYKGKDAPCGCLKEPVRHERRQCKYVGGCAFCTDGEPCKTCIANGGDGSSLASTHTHWIKEEPKKVIEEIHGKQEEGFHIPICQKINELVKAVNSINSKE